MNTGPIESWQNPAEIGAMYPFVGWEVPLFVICLIAWLAWMIWQMISENREYDSQVRQLQSPGEMDKVINQRAEK